MAEVGVVSEIWRHPVKSMQGERIEAGTIDGAGLAGDRRWGVFSIETDKVLSAKSVGQLLEAQARLPEAEQPPVITLPDGREFEAGDAGLDSALTAWLERPVELREAVPDQGAPWEFMVSELYPAEMGEYGLEEDVIEADTPPGSLHDLAAVHLLTTASIAAAAAEHADGDWNVRRFRPQLLVDSGSAAGYPENDWVGNRIRCGGAEIEGLMPTPRCVVPTRVQPGLERDLEIWKTLKRTNGHNLGLYAHVVSTGPVRVGDPVELIGS